MINIIKIQLIAILIAVSVNSAFAQAEDLNTQHIDDLNHNVLLLEGEFEKLQAINSKVLQENKFLTDSQSDLKRRYIQLLNDFGTYRKNTEIKINSLQEKISTNAQNLANTKNKFEDKIEILQKKINQDIADLNKKIRANIKNIKNKASELEQKIYDTEAAMNQNIIELNKKNKINSVAIEKTADALGAEIKKSETTTNQNISALNKTVRQNMLYWIVAVLAVALFIVIIFILLRKQIFEQKANLDNNLQNTRKTLEEEGLKLDDKLIEVLESQLKTIYSPGAGGNKEVDHSLALKVANEIIRIQKNLTRMDKKTKGLKQLNASVKRIQDNFSANGYELIEMLGKPYNEGMKVSANFIPDEDLEKGKEIITRIIKPQINFQGVMIQSAQIEVSLGEKE